MKVIDISNMEKKELHKWLEKNLEDDMYVRTRYGIDKFEFSIVKIDNNFFTYYFEKTSMTNPEYYIIKEPSFNIIDLIEVGDYVNGSIVNYNDMHDLNDEKFIECGDEEGNLTFYDKDIKSIVTKEQFKSMEYIVGDK